MHDMMLDFIFGWSKASKCKKLMKKVRCRLHLLRSKRSSIARHSRNDVAQLIKHGHYQAAFDRVDRIYMDECIIVVYDLLARFCEFLSHQFSYIRRSKDCPNDINEAISSLIFASARCGELPELLRLRKLFSKRYGERFEARALDLLPGNLVNLQIREYLSINKVPNEVKHKLVEEITRTVVQTGPLAINFTSQQAESSPANSTKLLPKDIIYQDKIEEFQSPDGENGKDQRVFMFTSLENAKTLNLLISLVEKLGDSMKVKSRSRVSSKMECMDYTSHGQIADNSEDRKTLLVSAQRTIHPSCHENGLIVRPNRQVGMCSKVISMPCTRWKKCGVEDGVVRSYSLPVKATSPHVHPKLPDYDELAAKFMALKKEKIQNKGLSTLEN